MDIRLNKLLSEAGICSRREADQFMETDRVTVNGKFPKMGQRVTAEDEVLVDGEKINVEKYLQLQEEQRREEEAEKELIRSLRTFKGEGQKPKRRSLANTISSPQPERPPSRELRGKRRKRNFG